MTYKELKDERIIVEIKNLMSEINSYKDDIDMYCEFMRERFLDLSGEN